MKLGIVKPLTILINRSLEEGIFPTELKIAKVIPLYKAKEKNSLLNYRPISILPTISKIFEKVIHQRLVKFFDKHKVLSEYQYGFRKNRSTLQAVSLFTLDILEALSNHKSILAVFIDLSKAFDTISHTTLSYKLQKYGIRGKPLQLIQNYLSNRKLYVSVNGVTSPVINLTEYGVPQGSILGPLLFLLYINDMPLILKSKCLLFADDTTIYNIGKSKDKIVERINNDLKELSTWFKCNVMKLNVTKSSYIYFTRSKEHILHDNMVHMDDQTISQVTSTKFLGIHIDHKLQWSHHINHLKSKISGGLYALNRLKNIVSPSILKQIYFTLVHSHLTYGCLLWGGAHSKHLKSLISSQKKALRIINQAKYNEASSPLFKKSNILKLKDLHHVQICQLMFLVHNKKISQNICAKFDKFLTCHDRVTRQSNKYRIPLIKFDTARRSILYHGPKQWSAIPIEVKQSNSATAFKSLLKKSLTKTY